ncbi:putative ferric-chelate reductase 1 [Gastrophryne carolinensis]
MPLSLRTAALSVPNRLQPLEFPSGGGVPIPDTIGRCIEKVGYEICISVPFFLLELHLYSADRCGWGKKKITVSDLVEFVLFESIISFINKTISNDTSLIIIISILFTISPNSNKLALRNIPKPMRIMAAGCCYWWFLSMDSNNSEVLAASLYISISPVKFEQYTLPFTVIAHEEMEPTKTLIFFVGLLTFVFGYPDGKISSACDSMLPQHGGNGPQSSAAPYAITVSKNSFNAGDTITVYPSCNALCGYWSGYYYCFPQAGWKVRKATVLQSYASYWTGVKSGIITALQISNTTCGTKKFCLSLPDGCSPSDSNCLFMSSSPSSDGIGYVFEMSGSTSGYVAIGFSDDTKMGNDDVYICTRNSSGSILVQHAFNVGTNPVISSNNTVGSVVASYVNGVMKCSFITQSAISTQQRATTGSSYYIFLVKGPLLANGQIDQHIQTLISSTQVDLSNYTSTSTVTGEDALVRAHGALMLIAWMTTASIGMILARYMKSSAGKPFLGKALWFQAHFLLMILTVILTIIAFIMIFVEAAGWSGDAGAHPILGCIVMVLSFFQPIGAFFRPDPKSEKRYIFNWAHRINALVIKILAVAAIFLGLNLVDKSSSQWMPKVMGGYFAWEVLFCIILEIIMHQKTKITYEITDDQVQPDTVILMVFIFGNLAFLITLLVGIQRS